MPEDTSPPPPPSRKFYAPAGCSERCVEMPCPQVNKFLKLRPHKLEPCENCLMYTWGSRKQVLQMVSSRKRVFCGGGIVYIK